MKWQMLLLTVAALVAFAIGGAKWRARFRAVGDLEEAERDGKWVMVVPRSPGIELRSRAGGVVEVPKPWRDVTSFEFVDATADLRRLAWIDATRYDLPKIQAASADAPGTPLATHVAAQGGTLGCPAFDADGALLWYETDPYNTSGTNYTRPQTTLQRLAISPAGKGTSNGTPRTIPLPVAVAPEDCFERSSDGSRLAWVGTDNQIHVVRREPSGALVDHKSFAGSDFALSSDGTFLAVSEAGRLARVEIATGKRAFVGEVRAQYIYALSPDDRWVLTQSVGSYNASTAWRLSDGAPVHMGTPSSYLTGQRRHIWIAWTGEVLPEPAATPKPSRTPRRPKPP